MRRHWFPKSYADFVARLRVPGGFLLLLAFLWLARPDALSLAAGVPVSLMGLTLRAWAAGHLAKNEQLADTGPYACVRNPLYAGSLVVAAGVVIAAKSIALGCVFAAVFLLVYLPVIELEEQHLRKLFPAYAAYADRVPLLIPSSCAGALTGFRASLYWRNQEYKAQLAYLAAVAYLFWKAGLLG